MAILIHISLVTYNPSPTLPFSSRSISGLVFCRRRLSVRTLPALLLCPLLLGRQTVFKMSKGELSLFFGVFRDEEEL